MNNKFEDFIKDQSYYEPWAQMASWALKYGKDPEELVIEIIKYLNDTTKNLQDMYIEHKNYCTYTIPFKKD